MRFLFTGEPKDNFYCSQSKRCNPNVKRHAVFQLTITLNCSAMKTILRVLPALFLLFLSLAWSDPAEAKWGNNNDNGRNSLVWQGRVDDKIDLYIQGRSVRPVVLSGRRPQNVRYDFDGRLPRRTVIVRIASKRGRGQVYVRQLPRSSNNYTAIVRVYDPKGGADRYRLRMQW